MTLKGTFYLTIALLIYGFTHITDKIGINNGVNPTIFSFFRSFFGLGFITLIWFALKKRRRLRFKKEYIKNLVIIGSLSSGLTVFLSILALSFTTATNKGIMQGMYTAFTLIFAYFLLHERLPKLFYPTFMVMIGGLVMLTSKGFLQLPNEGDWLLFGTVPLIGFCNVYARKTMKKLNSLTVSFGRYIFGSLFIVLMLFFFGIRDIASIKNGLLWAFLSGSFGSLRLICFYKGIKLDGPSLAATMLTISPVITAISSFLFLGERFNLLQIMGIILVLGGALLITRFEAEYKE